MSTMPRTAGDRALESPMAAGSGLAVGELRAEIGNAEAEAADDQKNSGESAPENDEALNFDVSSECKNRASERENEEDGHCAEPENQHGEGSVQGGSRGGGGSASGIDQATGE